MNLRFQSVVYVQAEYLIYFSSEDAVYVFSDAGPVCTS